MKRAGYPPAHTGGIEIAALSGGPIVLPLMGIVAFEMVMRKAFPPIIFPFE